MKKLSQYLLQSTKHPETGGKIEIKIYPPYAQVMFKFRSLGKGVFEPIS